MATKQLLNPNRVRRYRPTHAIYYDGDTQLGIAKYADEENAPTPLLPNMSEYTPTHVDIYVGDKRIGGGIYDEERRDKWKYGDAPTCPRCAPDYTTE